MKTVVILLGLFVTFVAADTECPLMYAIERSFDECIKITNANEKTMKNVLWVRGTHDEDTNCFRACMMNKAGLMTGAKVDVIKMEDMLNSCEFRHPKLRAFVGVMKYCKTQNVEVSDNKCHVVHNYMQCFEAKKRYFMNTKKKVATAKAAEAAILRQITQSIPYL